MWTRKELKSRGRKIVKGNYLKVVVICFLMAYMTGAYSGTGSTSLFVSYNQEQADDTALQTNIRDAKSNSEIVNQILDGVGREGNLENEKKYNRGVFASIFNGVTESGSFIFGFLNVFNQAFFQDKIGYSLVIFIGALISLLYWLLIKNVLVVCQNRFFLEASTYEKTPVSRMIFVMRIHRWRKTAVLMFAMKLYQMLWNLTLVGGVMKHYQYLMIPYLAAENPNISRKEAFLQSKRMMKGNKWKAFLLDMSFLGWNMLSILTFGFVGIFYLDPYMTATRTQLYLQIREEFLEKALPGYELFTDSYLGLFPALPEGEEKLPMQYPSELFAIPEYERRPWLKVDYRRNYSIYSLVLLFFSFSIIGWLWEVSLHLSADGFVNRGVLHGPWLPIYGTGGVLILVLLKKYRENPMLTFLLTVVICGVVEYATSYYLEVTKGAKWWDYSGYLLNLNGRICAEGLLVFGLGGCGFIYFAAPLLDSLYEKIPVKIQRYLCLLLLAGLLGDVLYSYQYPNMGKGITDYDTSCLPPICELLKNRKQL